MAKNEKNVDASGGATVVTDAPASGPFAYLPPDVRERLEKLEMAAAHPADNLPAIVSPASDEEDVKAAPGKGTLEALRRGDAKVSYGRVDPKKVKLLDNPRTKGDLKLEIVRRSIATEGFDSTQPLVVSRHYLPDGSFYDNLLQGYRRLFATLAVWDTDPVATAKWWGDDRTIPAQIHEGLTDAQETVILCDHGPGRDRLPLSKWGQYLNARKLIGVGLSQDEVAKRMGLYTAKGVPNRAYTQILFDLARLPAFVRAEVEKLWTKGESATPMRRTFIRGLYQLYREGAVKYPDGSPAFLAEWRKIMDGEKKTSPAETPPKPVGIEQAQMAYNDAQSTAVKRAIASTFGLGEGEELAAVDADMVALEDAAARYELIDRHFPAELSALYGKALDAEGEAQAKAAQEEIAAQAAAAPQVQPSDAPDAPAPAPAKKNGKLKGK